MALRFLRFSALLLATATFMGCGGGGSGGGAAAIRACGEAGSFCLVNCNLGCNFKGCSLTDIAQNQPLLFSFSRDVDPASVGFGSISLKTASGAEPVGNFFVEGSTVTFVPDVLNLGGAAFFGFTAGETYFLEIAGGTVVADPLRATSGDLLGESVRCAVRISLGVVDLDNKPPRVKVISPAVADNVPLNTAVVLEFDELIDHSVFTGVTGKDAPVVFQLRGAVPVDPSDPNSALVCDPFSTPRILSGNTQLVDDKARSVTILSFLPQQPLSGSRCLEIGITTGVRDLAGTPAQPQFFRFITEISTAPPMNLDETFDSDLMLDRERSNGSWSGGTAIFGKAGGDGRLGDFDITDGVSLNPPDDTMWQWSTDGMTIVSDELLSSNYRNQPVAVTNGEFHFTSFFLPEEMTLRIVGSNPLRIFVRGNCDIAGRIELNGVDTTLWDGKARDASGTYLPLPQTGQAGSLGGAGGGGGGRGAPTAGTSFSGSDVKLLPGNAFDMRRLGTGGRGGPLVPEHGDPSQIDFTTPPPTFFFGTQIPESTFAQYTSGGGSGGGLFLSGEDGRVLLHAFKTELRLPPAVPPATVGVFTIPLLVDPDFISEDGVVPGGIFFDFLPKPDASTSDHYVVGGSGGGGGGSHAMLALRSAPPALTIEPVLFSTGAGGGGGGGAVAIRVGRSFNMGASSSIACRGGSTADQTRLGLTFPDGIAAPGGAGSGGSILLMVDGEGGNFQGSLDVSGGTAGVATLALPPVVAQQNGKFAYDTRGGDGSHGYIRYELDVSNPTIDRLGLHIPAGSGEVAELTEDWPLVGFQSLWYETGEVFAPLFLRYEIEAEVNGVTTIYSDDPSVGTLAQHGTSPLSFYIQGGDIVSNTGQVLNPDEVDGWHQYVGGSFNPNPGGGSLNGDNKNGFRWILILDRGFLGPDVVVKRVRIVFKP